MSDETTIQTDVLFPGGDLNFDYTIDGMAARITAWSNSGLTTIQFTIPDINLFSHHLATSDATAQTLLTYVRMIYPDIRRLLIFLTWTVNEVLTAENLACDPSTEWIQQIAEGCAFALEETYFKLQEPQRAYAAAVVGIAANRKARPGFVYVIVAENSYCKIGKTTNPDDRLSRLQTGNPFQIRYEILIRCDDNHAVEQALHRRFDQKNMTGEWFRLSPEDINDIKFLIRDFGQVR